MTDLIKNNNFTKLSKAFEVEKLSEILEEASRSGGRKNGYTKKKSFSPSSFYHLGNGVCFSGETEFVTDEGVKTLAEQVGREVTVWTGPTRINGLDAAGGWKKARVESFGVHPLMRATLRRNGVEREEFVTGTHRWIVQSGKWSASKSRAKAKVKTTLELEPGDLLWHSEMRNALKNTTISPDGIRHGIVYGDGSCDTGYSQRNNGSYIVLHGAKDFELLGFFGEYSVGDVFLHNGADNEYMINNHVPCRKVYGLPRSYKRLPDLTESSSYLYGWLAGYFAADGNIHDAGSATITSHKKESILAVRDVCAVLGINSSPVRTAVRTKLGRDYAEYSIGLPPQELPEDFFLLSHHKEYHRELVEKDRRSPRKWEVVSIEATDRVEEVFCVVQPETERFALADGILTMNCPRYWYFALNGEEFEYENTARQRANMDSGTAAGDRIAKLFDEAGLLLEAEAKAIYSDPPIFGYIDLIVEWQGEEMIGEVKTTKTESFATRAAEMKAPGYQMIQLLLYMYVKGKDKGFFVIEDKNTHELLVIPVKMTDERKRYIEYVLNWMRAVYRNAHEGDLPVRPFTKSSFNCKSCPVKKACWPEGKYNRNSPNDPLPGKVELLPLEVID